MASSGNFFTMNPIVKGTQNVSSGNCKLDLSTNNRGALGTFEIPLTGKWYFECFAQMGTAVEGYVGISDRETDLQSSRGGITDGNMYGFGFSQYTGSNYFSIKVTGGTADNSGRIDEGTTNNAVLGIAVNRDDNELKLYTNNTLRFTLSISATTLYYPFFGVGGGNNSSYFMYLNAGADSSFGGNKTAGGNSDGNGFGDFFYSPPSNHLALCSPNVPTSTAIDPAETDDNFPQKQCGVVTYTGNAGTNAISGLGFQPDLVWIKIRNTASNGPLVDSSRGSNKVLFSQVTNSEATSANLASFDSDGFTVNNTSDYLANFNGNTNTYVAWCWKANGGTTATNTSGDITSTVQANQAAGFSIVQWTANATSSVATTVGHGLSKAPEFVITKSRESSSNWCVTHTGLSSTSHMLFLNTNAVESDKSGNGSMSANTSTVFSVNATDGSNAPNGDNMIAYCWHSVEGYSKFGKYEGNANADGAFVYTGFRPRILIIRVLNVASDGWLMYDTERETFNPLDTILKPHSDAAEYSNAAFTLDIVSNGFKLRSSDNAVNGTSYDPYIYMAWGAAPFKYNNTF